MSSAAGYHSCEPLKAVPYIGSRVGRKSRRKFCENHKRCVMYVATRSRGRSKGCLAASRHFGAHTPGGAPRDELDRCCRAATVAAGPPVKLGGPCQVPPQRRDYGGVATVQGVQHESPGRNDRVCGLGEERRPLPRRDGGGVGAAVDRVQGREPRHTHSRVGGLGKERRPLLRRDNSGGKAAVDSVRGREPRHTHTHVCGLGKERRPRPRRDDGGGGAAVERVRGREPRHAHARVRGL